MRLALLHTTALAAVGLTAGSGSAADGVRLEIGGSYMGAAGVVLGEDASAAAGIRERDLRDYVFKQDVEIRFSGETILDNGLTVGAAVELEGQSDSEDQVDKAYAYFSGGFGELRFGDLEEAYAQFCYLAPSASEMFGADSPNFSFSNAGIAGYAATNGTCYGLDGSSTKIVYFSPILAGFQFAASFTPDATGDTRNTLDGAGTRFDDGEDQNSENLSVGVTYHRDVDDVSLVLGGGITQSLQKETNPGNVDPARSANAYAQLELSGFTIGAAAEMRQNLGETDADRWVVGVGATYGWDDWKVGLGWSHGDYEEATGDNGVGPFDAEHDIYALTASRALSKGISVDGVIELSDYESRDGAGPDYRGVAVGLGTEIEF